MSSLRFLSVHVLSKFWLLLLALRRIDERSRIVVARRCCRCHGCHAVSECYVGARRLRYSSCTRFVMDFFSRRRHVMLSLSTP